MKKIVSLILALVMVLALAACGNNAAAPAAVPAAAPAAEQPAAEAAKEESPAEAYVAPDYEIPEKYTKVNGHDAVFDSEVEFTEEEIAKIKAGNYKIGISLHYGGNDWATGLVTGVKSICEELGVEVCAVTDAGWEPVQQSTDLENIMALSPDAIIIVPTDATVMAAPIKEVSAAGVKVIISESVPNDLADDDYVSFVTADAYANGVASGKAMAQALGGKGKVGVFYFESSGEGMINRHQGFIDYLTACTDITVEVMQSFKDPNKTSEVAEAVFVKYPDLDGAWASWDVPAEGVMSAAKAQNMKEGFVITTIDLGVNVGRTIAEDGIIKGVGAQKPYYAGRVEAKLALKAILGSETPKFVHLEALPVTRDNLLAAWPEVYAVEAPEEIANLLK